MNYRQNVPPGCHPDDTGTGDNYECACCGQGFEQGELDPDQDEPTCKECAAVERERVREEDKEVRLQQAAPALLAALQTIEAWALPATGRTWDDGSPMSYGAAFGSNGERDYMREVARKALAIATQGGAQ